MKKFPLFLCTLVLAVLYSCSGKVDSSIPLAEHPRPDFERAQWMNLNGHWAFTFDEAAATKAISENDLTGMDQSILVPFPWGSKLSEVEDKGDIGWYGREITVPSSWKGKRVFLVVGASDWDTSVWLDGKQVGSHQGGYTPFECELTDVRFGEAQKVVIKADDTPSNAHLYGKQGYGNARGIWQTVYLEARGGNYIKSLHFSPDIDNSCVKVDVALAAPAAKGENFKLTFKTGGQDRFSADLEGKDNASFVIPIKDQHLWDLDDPFLYEVTAALGNEDEVSSYFGQRKIGVAEAEGQDFKYVALNNKPIYLQLCLDQSYHPEGYYTFPSDEFMKNEIQISKNLGLNGNRIHIKVEVPRKLYWADKLGLLIMADTPNFWGEPVPEAREDWENCLRGQVERDYNHPSIFAWVNFNETWGLSYKEGGYTKESQEWVRDMYHLTKALDPTRLVEDQSACNHDHVESDINSWHAYCRGFIWEDVIKEYEDNTYPGSHFNYIGDNVQNGAPMINSECGNVWGYDGSAGDCDFTWDYHIMIDAFRRHPKCAGWLYTEHHDVINEWNGYVKYDRSPKIDGLGDLVPGMTIADFQSLYYISPDKYLYTEHKPGEVIDIPLFASFMTDKDPGELTLETELVRWDRLGEFKSIGTAELPIPFEPYLNRVVANQRIAAPQENGLYLIRMVLKSGDEVLHHNFTTLRVREGFDDIPLNNRLISFTPASYTASEWSQGQTSIFDGLKVDGFGHGYFEYTVKFPEDLDIESISGAELIFEASAKEKFGKDKEGDSINGDFMLGGGTFDHCKSANAYAMTDNILWPSKIVVTVNGVEIGKCDLADDPADHRGILSWAAQPNVRQIREGGSYGELVRLKIPIDRLPAEEILRARAAVIRITVPAEDLDGGLAIYGKDFGRYPLDPTVVLTF